MGKSMYLILKVLALSRAYYESLPYLALVSRAQRSSSLWACYLEHPKRAICETSIRKLAQSLCLYVRSSLPAWDSSLRTPGTQITSSQGYMLNNRHRHRFRSIAHISCANSVRTGTPGSCFDSAVITPRHCSLFVEPFNCRC